MLFLRSLLFQTAFYLGTLIMMIVFAPFVFLTPRRVAWIVVPFWARANLLFLRWFAGVTLEVRGAQHIPQGGFIVASKHQSVWETFALIPHFRDPTYILKRELRWIPIFGWYTAKMKQIPINRGKRAAALAAMMDAAKEAIGEGRQILIFPEGTRRPAGGEPKYKFGISHLYRELECPVLPVALNAGVYWPRQSFFIYPGKVILEFLPPIAPGLDQQAFFDRLTGDIETASDRLLEEARAEARPSPVLRDIPVRAAS
ncbi:1-acyl-sn-glycerol-3-phosphate acyltransferase [Microvirga tunisiensis]|uniref:1-acyl-sn-glycerol-3-phosphate acyltransferase n=2 Tax=Pannonibacter tanglangensis TaxID=2750084 RepID=A0A7X5F5P3_9HYPH|nr:MULTISPECIES: lysophospholipid acyltransferase family protein [unclassified Pannonibacter]NBN65531.1 1-acyl-sn-glycerol-3-phosphate acyltransferase [Pannonibacter sp. XCT-34]NBN80242.1 1-acyl-sn-glycerol-3-phosphate acyltransferase [Pannonibacter sp. XCT-53]